MPSPLALLLPLLHSALAEEAEPRPDPLVVMVPLSALEPPPEPPPQPPVAFSPSSLRVRLSPGAETRIELDLELDVHSAEALSLPIIGAALAIDLATLDGRAIALPPDPDGWRRLVTTLPVGRHRLRVQGTVATPRPQLSLPLLASPRTEISVDKDWELRLADAQRSAQGPWLLTPRSSLDLSWSAPVPPSPRPQVVQARLVAALRVDTTGIQGRARVQATVLHAPTGYLDLRLPAVQDLQVQGPAVAGWEQRGDTVRVSLVRPLDGRIDLDLSWSAPAPGSEGGAVTLPMPLTSSGQLESGTLSLLAGDQGTIIPMAGRGLDPIPASAVPAWGRGLVDGAPVATLSLTSASPDLVLRVLDLSPVEAPPTFVDEARIEVAYAAHGRALLRCRYQVRNDRNQYLVLTLPPGARPLGVRVAGTVVQPVRDGDRLLIPLEKSVETLTGLVSFPVEVALISPEEPWSARGQRQLQAPSVDAPVNRATWEIVLPPGARSRDIEGRPTLVDAWSEQGEGPVIGRAIATGSTSLAQEDEAEGRREQSQDAWNQAYRAYQDNEFEAARGMLEQSLAWDDSNKAAQELLGNVNVLVGDEADRDDDQARRVRSMARAKTSGTVSAQTEKKQEATEALRAGDYKQAKEALIELEELTRELVAVEDAEVVDQKQMLEETRNELNRLGYLLADEDAVEEQPQPVIELPPAEPEPVGVITERRQPRANDDPAKDDPANDDPAEGQPSDGEAVQLQALVIDELRNMPAQVAGSARGRGGGSEGRAASAPSAPVPAPPPPPPPSGGQQAAPVSRAFSSAVVSATPSPPAGATTATLMDPGVTAAPLSVRPPRAGQRLLLEQNLLAPGESLTLDLSYRFRD